MLGIKVNPSLHETAEVCDKYTVYVKVTTAQVVTNVCVCV